MDANITTLYPDAFPAPLREIPDPPEKLYATGALPPDEHACLCVVGSRKASSYGTRATRELISALRGAPITIVSGLALGIDAIAHEAALEAGLHTLAVPGSGLNHDVLYPRSNVRLAERILESGGGLISELSPNMRASKWSFPRRNRIMAGMSHTVLIIEAAARSGTLITARLGLEYNREVCAVPGSIFDDGSAGTLSLISDGARPIATSDNLREACGLDNSTAQATAHFDRSTLNPTEAVVYDLLAEQRTRDEVIRYSSYETSNITLAITQLELRGIIAEDGGTLRRCV